MSRRVVKSGCPCFCQSGSGSGSGASGAASGGAIPCVACGSIPSRMYAAITINRQSGGLLPCVIDLTVPLDYIPAGNRWFGTVTLDCGCGAGAICIAVLMRCSSSPNVMSMQVMFFTGADCPPEWQDMDFGNPCITFQEGLIALDCATLTGTGFGSRQTITTDCRDRLCTSTILDVNQFQADVMP